MFEWLMTKLVGLMDILVPLFYKKKGVIVFLGLDDAGKTSLMYRLKEGKMLQTAPTPRPTNEVLTLGRVTFNTYDMGGHKQARRVWKDYTLIADGIVFMIDASNSERFDESKAELDSLLSDHEVLDVPIAVLVNKIDIIPQAASVDYIRNYFKLQPSTGKLGSVKGDGRQGRARCTRPLGIFPCSVLQEQGYGVALLWLADYF